MKLTMAIKKHNKRKHDTASQLPKIAWFTDKGEHQVMKWNTTRHGGNCPLGGASNQYREVYGGGWKDRAWSSTRFWEVCKPPIADRPQ